MTETPIGEGGTPYGHAVTYRVCREPGCPTLVSDAGHCAQHRPIRSKPRTPRLQTYRTDKHWAALSRIYRQRHPTCECSPGCTDPSEQTHHRDGLGLDGPLAYEWSNLQALSVSHHSRITARQPRMGRVG